MIGSRIAAFFGCEFCQRMHRRAQAAESVRGVELTPKQVNYRREVVNLNKSIRGLREHIMRLQIENTDLRSLICDLQDESRASANEGGEPK